MGQPDHDRFEPINNCLHEIYAKETNEMSRSLPFLGNLFAIENCVDLFTFSSLSYCFFLVFTYFFSYAKYSQSFEDFTLIYTHYYWILLGL